MIAARLQASSPTEPFADDAAGLDYFATDFHYEHLVARLCRHLAATRAFVLVSGVPAPDGELVERALNARKDAPHRATLVRCRAGMTLDAVTRAYGRQLGLKDDADGADQWSLLSRLMEDSRKGVVRVLVLENADALDDRSFDALHRFATLDDPHFLPVVLLTARNFAARLDAPSLQFLQPAVVAHLALQHLEPEEVAAFVRYQINATDGRHEAAFTREAIAAIAAAAKGDPAAVNRLARQAAGILGRSHGPMSPPAPTAPPPQPAAAAKPKPKPPEPPAAKVVQAVRPVAVKPAAERASAPSAAKPSFTAATLAKVSAASRESAASAAPRSAARRARARGMVPAVTLAGYILLAAASAAALLYLLAPGADHDAETLAAQAPQIRTMITGDMPAPAPPLAQPAATDASPAVPPAPQNAKPPAEPPQPRASPQPAAEPPAAAARPTPGEGAAHALAAIEPTASAKPPSQAVAKVEAEPAPTPPRAADKPPSAAAAPLVRRGEELLASGDIASARHFFERAAETGDAAAACGLGKSYDPLFLQRVGTRGVAGDAAKAAGWYRRAARAGSNEAAARLARLLVKFPQ